jgi:hypothetical protein
MWALLPEPARALTHLQPTQLDELQRLQQPVALEVKTLQPRRSQAFEIFLCVPANAHK